MKALGAFLFLFAVIGLVVAVCGMMNDSNNRYPGWLLLIALVLGILGYWMMPAAAHDHSRPGLNDWYPTLRSPAGSPCCDGPSVDAVHLADVDWESRDGRYRVRIDGQWIDVPPGAVLTGPNRDGRTLVWPSWSDGQRTVRCFMPGAMI